ncbi:MAG TPA: hypothetical protein VGB76_16250 [Pyrinomonadaceae bacterium]|jgi:hypothetical protein
MAIKQTKTELAAVMAFAYSSLAGLSKNTRVLSGSQDSERAARVARIVAKAENRRRARNAKKAKL